MRSITLITVINPTDPPPQQPQHPIFTIILLMDQWPPIKLAQAQKVEDYATDINLGSFDRIMVDSRPMVMAMARV